MTAEFIIMGPFLLAAALLGCAIGYHDLTK